MELRRWIDGPNPSPSGVPEDLIAGFLAIPIGRFPEGTVQFNYTFRDRNGDRVKIGSSGGSAAFTIAPKE